MNINHLYVGVCHLGYVSIFQLIVSVLRPVASYSDFRFASVRTTNGGSRFFFLFIFTFPGQHSTCCLKEQKW